MKKLLCLLLAAAMLFLFSSCSDETVADPLTVNGTPINAEIFKFYLDEGFGNEALGEKSDIIQYATEQCIRYVAVNSAFEARGLALSAGEAAEVSERGNALWRFFGAHYEKIGVSKQTFIKIQTSLAYTEALRYALFDKGGVMPIADDMLKSYLSSEYVAFKALSGNLYDTDVYGNRVELTEEQLKNLGESYATAANQINIGGSLEYVYASLINSGNEEVRQSLETVVIADGDPFYPEGFYAAVKEIEEKKAEVKTFGDNIYLIYRVDILSDPDLYEKHRDACLIPVSEPYLQSEINTMCNAYTSVRKSAQVERCYTAVKEGRK